MNIKEIRIAVQQRFIVALKELAVVHFEPCCPHHKSAVGQLFDVGNTIKAFVISRTLGNRSAVFPSATTIAAVQHFA